MSIPKQFLKFSQLCIAQVGRLRRAGSTVWVTLTWVQWPFDMRAITNITHYELSFYFKCIEFFKIFQILTTEQTMAAMHDCSSQFADNTSFQFLISYWTKEVQIDRDQSWSAFISIQNSKGYSCSHKLWGVWVWKKTCTTLCGLHVGDWGTQFVWGGKSKKSN